MSSLFSLFVGSYQCHNFISQFWLNCTVSFIYVIRGWFVSFSTAPLHHHHQVLYYTVAAAPSHDNFNRIIFYLIASNLFCFVFVCVCISNFAKISIKWKMNSSTIVNFIITTFILNNFFFHLMCYSKTTRTTQVRSAPMSRPSEGKTENSSDEGSRMKWKVSPWKIKIKKIKKRRPSFPCLCYLLCWMCTFKLLENAHVSRHIYCWSAVGWWPSVFYIQDSFNSWWSRVRWNPETVGLDCWAAAEVKIGMSSRWDDKM